MKLIADLHIHSKYSRAVSQEMILPKIAEWVTKKGIGLVATGDWTHPLWLREIKATLEEVAPGLYGLKSETAADHEFFHSTLLGDRFQSAALARRPTSFSKSGKMGGVVDPSAKLRVDTEQSRSIENYGLASFQVHPLFILSTEISSIYSQGGRLRRIHNLVLAPSIEIAEKINKALVNRGANLMSDGRPITGIPASDLVKLILSVDERCLLIPAHCLLPETLLHTKSGLTRIDKIRENDLVFTHKGRLQKVTKVLKRKYQGEIYHIKPFYFSLGLKTTKEHPFYVIKTKKNCKSTKGFCRLTCSAKETCRKKEFLKYQPEWIRADQLETSDILLYPRFKTIKDIENIGLQNNRLAVDENFCRLIGYYLAEGYTDNRDSVSFCFSNKETKYIDDVKKLMKDIFSLTYCREYERKQTKGKELIFFSKTLACKFSSLFYSSSTERRAFTKCLPNWMLFLPLKKQVEIVKGWWRGDNGYTSSRLLANQMKIIFLRLGIIPSIRVDTTEAHSRRGNHQFGKRIIKAQHDNFCFSNLSFLEDEDNLLLENEFKMFKTKMKRRHGWLDRDYIYIPIKGIEISNYQGEVYNLEVENDHSYLAEFAAVHNCWTPWFSLYGSESGFDSIDECFGEMSKYIYAVETGLSSDPAMNWRISELDNRSIISCSDAHSGPKLGREATVFELNNLSYSAIREAFIQKTQSIGVSENRISHTLEFYPEEGKYHYSGHRTCNIKQSPEETKKLGEICPVCGKKLTIGVMHRVEQLAHNTENLTLNTKIDKNGVKWIGYQNKPPYAMLVPLQEILAESLGGLPTSQNIRNEYEKLVEVFRDIGEFGILLNKDIREIGKISGEKVAEGIRKVRAGEITVEPGYDGVFGVVKIWRDGRRNGKDGGNGEKEQMSLF